MAPPALKKQATEIAYFHQFIAYQRHHFYLSTACAAVFSWFLTARLTVA